MRAESYVRIFIMIGHTLTYQPLGIEQWASGGRRNGSKKCILAEFAGFSGGWAGGNVVGHPERIARRSAPEAFVFALMSCNWFATARNQRRDWDLWR